MDRLQSRHIRLIYVLVFFVILITKVSGIPEREPEVSCPSIDVRNTPKELEKIGNCTVIKGSLMIVLIQKSSASNFAKYSFPKLREITDFLLIDDVAGLTRLDTLFPNLTVIRGRRLFLNYALSIYALKDLEIVGLKSLIAIQRGHIFIDRCPKLCYLEKVNWDQITLSQGVNHIRSDGNSNHTCSNLCRSCANCWSSFDCQKFQDANLVNLLRKGKCHPQCLGGCFSNQTTPDNCLLCRNFSIDGKCVEECPKNRYSSKDHLRCYTAGECADLGFYIHQNECVPFCPSGYEYKGSTNDILRKCELCTDDCPRTCNGSNIHNLADSEFFGGCKIVNGSIIMRIPGKVNEDELKSNLQEIQEIKGYLKIYETPSMTSMEVFRDLVIIGGNRLAYRHFGLLIYGNKYLTKLWDFDKKKELQIHNSSIFMHSNYRLCNSYIKKLVDVANHNLVFDEIQYNDQEVSCDPITINIKVEAVTHNTALVIWDAFEITEKTTLFYTEIIRHNQTSVDYDCERKLWMEEEVYRKIDNESTDRKSSFLVTDLKPFTLYQVFIKTDNFHIPLYSENRCSKIRHFLTKPDIPTAPILYTFAKRPGRIILGWLPFSRDITSLIIDYFEHSEDVKLLDKRNYCSEPFDLFELPVQVNVTEDCCEAAELDGEDLEFERLMHQRFGCSFNNLQFCKDAYYSNLSRIHGRPTSPLSATYNKTIHMQGRAIRAMATLFDRLKPYTLYTFRIYACNDLDCGTPFQHSERTVPWRKADVIQSINISDTEKLVKVQPLRFVNGAALAYYIFTKNISARNSGQAICLTRQTFEDFLNYRFHVEKENSTVAIRVLSLAGLGKVTRWVLVQYKEPFAYSASTIAGIIIGTGLVCTILAYTICMRQAPQHQVEPQPPLQARPESVRPHRVSPQEFELIDRAADNPGRILPFLPENVEENYFRPIRAHDIQFGQVRQRGRRIRCPSGAVEEPPVQMDIIRNMQAGGRLELVAVGLVEPGVEEHAL